MPVQEMLFFLHAKAKDQTRMHRPQGALCRGCCRMPVIEAIGSIWDGSCDCKMVKFGSVRQSVLLSSPQCHCSSLLLLCQPHFFVE